MIDVPTVVTSRSRYKLTTRLGRGGMAEVFGGVMLGEHGFERRIALKRMLPGADEASAEMFLDEARIASCLHHGNIVGIIDYGVLDKTPFQVLELVDGIDAATLLRRAEAVDDGLPLAVALHIATEIAHGLAYAHDATASDGHPLGVVHRDVKPANILVARNGEVKLGDFGIAFARNRTQQQTVAGTAKGTPLFMPPEQFLGGSVDVRSDVFALGCVIHTLCCGASPLAGDDVVASFLSGLVPLRLDERIPEDIRAVIARATQYSKTARYPTMAELADALGATLATYVDNDPRAMFRDWLARTQLLALAPASEPVEFEIGQTEATSPHEYSVVFTEPDVGATRNLRPPSKNTPRARRTMPLLVGIGSLLALAASVGAWKLTHHEAPVVETTSTPIPTKAPVTPVETKSAPPQSTPPQPTTPQPTSPQPVTPQPTTPKKAHHHTEPRVETTTIAPQAEWSGTIAIGGEALFNAEIFIDGHSVGFAPRSVTVRGGRHQVYAVRDHKQSSTITVEVEPQHTSRSPLRIAPSSWP